MSGNNTLRSLDRALSLLQLISQTNYGYTLSEISRLSGLDTATAFRILNTLERNSFLQRGTFDHKYYLGAEIANLYHAYSTSFFSLLSQRSAPIIKELQNKWRETAAIYVIKSIQHNQRICIYRVDGEYVVRSVINVGDCRPLIVGASGKALVAFLPEKDIRYLQSIDPNLSSDELETVRKTGYATSDGAREVGVAGIAAPIFNSNHDLIASVTVTGPSSRLLLDNQKEIVSDVILAANEIGKLF